jgi:hypothetical protein
MSASVRAVVDYAVADAGDGWRAFLAQRLEPTWRPGEWDPDTLIFTGDPENPRTFVYLCADPGCRNPTDVELARHEIAVLRQL